MRKTLTSPKISRTRVAVPALPPAALDGVKEAAHFSLRVSEIRYRRLFEAARDGVLLLDPDTGQITDVNPFMIEFLDYTREEFLGKELWEIGRLEDQETSRKIFRELLKKHFVRYENLPLKSRTGRTREVEVVANLYQEDANLVIQCNIRDITERKAIEDRVRVSERRYRRLFETARDGILILDPETRQIIEVNPCLIALLGYSRAEFLGKELWEIGLRRDGPASPEAFQELKEKGHIRYENLPIETKAGEQREVEFVSNRYSDDGHAVIKCNILDITERRRMEKELLAAKIEISRLAMELKKTGTKRTALAQGL